MTRRATVASAGKKSAAKRAAEIIYDSNLSLRDTQELERALLRDDRERVRALEALEALTIWSRNGEQLCFRTHNGIPMDMSKKQEKLARLAIARRLTRRKP
jgi:hypothetical protein